MIRRKEVAGPLLAPFVALVATALLSLGTIAGALHWRAARQSFPALPAAFPAAMPVRVLWAWEEPEDLHALAPSVGIAYLAETLLLSDHVAILPRRQPLTPPVGAVVMTVVRIETRSGFADTPELRNAVASRLVRVVEHTSSRALQIDFDAARSQQPFYAGVLRELRPRLAPGLPLSITALVSWCGSRSWLRGLPVDEAVPMFFRMGGPRAISTGLRFPAQLAEPLCRSSLGLATDEPWPAKIDAQPSIRRIYLFAPRPWRSAQISAVASAPLPLLAEELAR